MATEFKEGFHNVNISFIDGDVCCDRSTPLCAKTSITEGSSRKPHDELRGPHLYPRKSEEIGLGVFTNPTITAIHISRQSWATKGKYTIQSFFF